MMVVAPIFPTFIGFFFDCRRLHVDTYSPKRRCVRCTFRDNAQTQCSAGAFGTFSETTHRLSATMVANVVADFMRELKSIET